MPGFDGVAVLGAGGTIGPAIVRDLAESEEIEQLLLLDRDVGRAEAVAVASARGGSKATAVVVDAADSRALAAALRAAGAAVVVNAASYQFNLPAMEGALSAGCHYVDLGGLYHTTLEQLGLDSRFRAAGLTAVLGMGASPGKTNLLAALAASRFDQVEALHVSAAARDPTPPGHSGLAAPYAIATILDELTLDAVVLRSGSLESVPALSDGGEILFPDPIGTRRSVFTLHSELATFGSSFPGLREASFRLSLAPALADRVEFLARCGLADLAPVAVGGVAVVPRDVLLACLSRSGSTVPPSNQTTAIHMVEAQGAGPDGVVRVAAVTVPHQRWGLGGGVVSTAAPAAEAARRLLCGDVPTGVLPPEQAFDPEPFLAALTPTGCTVTVSA
jgi:saccharopine dehydrogenase (NAD+, L-lysine-forming)